MKNNITFKALSELLVIIYSWLQQFFILAKWLPIFPSDARTLLGTNKRKHDVKSMQCQNGKIGEFVFGVSNNLRERVKSSISLIH